MPHTLLWFRKDLRIQDNLALNRAVELGKPIIPVFIYSPEEETPWAPGGASQWWLHYALKDLDAHLNNLGSRLILLKGNTEACLQAIINEFKVNTVLWNRRYEPTLIQRDIHLKQSLSTQGLTVESFNTHLFFEPGKVLNKSNKPFKVFTPFWKHCLTLDFQAPEVFSAKSLPAPEVWPQSRPLEALGLLPKIKWYDGIKSTWDPTLDGAQQHLARFIKDACEDYKACRDFPEQEGTSRLSPYLHFGQMTPRQIHQAVVGAGQAKTKGGQCYLSEVGWREFGYHLLYHFPKTPLNPLDEKFNHFPWRNDYAEDLKAWQTGQTGYPIVDAGMRQLYQTGWLHNRLRMVVASFLVKHLLIPWQEGAYWFWDTLVDADLASNTLGWQWTAGCGADAAPYFRVFNPLLQGARFDPEGNFVKRYVPELARLPNQYIHQPWEAPNGILQHAGIELGRDYPKPIVDHKLGRDNALAAYQELKDRTQ